MTNLLLNIATEPAGRALLAVPRAAVSSAQSSNVTRFGDALFDVQIPVLAAVVEGDASTTATTVIAPTDPSLRALVSRLPAEPAEERGAEQPQPSMQMQASSALPIALPTPPTSQTPAAAATTTATTIALATSTPTLHTAARTSAVAGTSLMPESGVMASVARPIATDPSAANITTSAQALAPPLASALTGQALPGLRTDAAAGSLLINGEQIALLSVEPTAAFAVSLPTHSIESSAAPASAHPSVIARPSLAALLGERLEVQIQQRSEHAVIRLDPPSMGSIEIVIRQEAGGLQVHMRASNPEVARQLHAIGDTLRQDLVQRQHGDVSVQVSDHSRDGDGRQRQRPTLPYQNEPGRALREAGDEKTPDAFSLNAE